MYDFVCIEPSLYQTENELIDLHSTRCPVFDDEIESAKHLFIDCEAFKNLWLSVMHWCNLDNFLSNMNELVSWEHIVHS